MSTPYTFTGRRKLLNKEAITDLALLGGPKLFEDPVHVGAPNLGNRTMLWKLLEDALDRRWLTNDGPYVQEFERRLCDLLAVRRCVATCNATSALMVLVAALGLRGHAILPALTFVATPHALQWQGVTPVFCDVDEQSWTLDPYKVEELVSAETSAIVGVHLWGKACDIDNLQQSASRHGLALIFDAAHALGCSYRGRLVGSFGDAEVLSFHATKVCNSFEGGAIVTDDEALAKQASLIRNFGFEDLDTVASLGTNAKMSEASAAMGIVSLASLNDFVLANNRNLQAYRKGLESVAGVSLREPDPHEKSNNHYVVVEIDSGAAGLERDDLYRVLWAENVLARRYFYPGCHRLEPYRSLWPEVASRLPVTERVLSRVLVLPTGTATNVETVQRICEVIALAIENSAELTPRLRDTSLSPERNFP
jgi:dTDP-4-amino-4,6-dideoxygalactose transaminase